MTQVVGGVLTFVTDFSDLQPMPSTSSVLSATCATSGETYGFRGVFPGRDGNLLGVDTNHPR